MNRDTAERCTILRGLVGSTVHGLNVNDGIEDRDEMGICVEPFAEAMSLGRRFEQFIYRSAAEREGRPDARSTAGDLDFDTKYAMHMLRLGFQGVELLTTGRLSLPMREPERSFLLDVRRGRVSEAKCLAEAGELEKQLTDLATTSPLPEAPESDRVERWMFDAYRRRWSAELSSAQ